MGVFKHRTQLPLPRAQARPSLRHLLDPVRGGIQRERALRALPHLRNSLIQAGDTYSPHHCSSAGGEIFLAQETLRATQDRIFLPSEYLPGKRGNRVWLDRYGGVFLPPHSSPNSPSLVRSFSWPERSPWRGESGTSVSRSQTGAVATGGSLSSPSLPYPSSSLDAER